MESTSYVLSFLMVFFYLVTTGWIFDISLCENSINSINQSKYRYNSREVRAHDNILAKRASSLDGRGRDSKPCRVQRACAASYRGKYQQGHPST